MDLVKFYNLLIESNFNYTTDTRKITEGSIFFALKGANFNGNSFAIEALGKGAVAAVVDENVGSKEGLIQVDNVSSFFQQVASFHRRCFDIPVIGIAGSNGKTTTKNLIYNVLSKKYKTHCTQGNFNNHIGVPLTLLDIPADCELAIVELGTNNPGEIAELCKIAEPNYGLITNIGKEHLEGFGSLEAVAKEESELYLWLKENNHLAFVNADDEHLSRMGSRLANKKMYSKSQLKDVTLVPEISFKYQDELVKSPLMGDYNLDNILAAINLGEHFGVSKTDIIAGIEGYKPDNNRSQLIKSGSNLILLDAYNANPSSMQKAIENFVKLEHKTKVLVLGDMFEMGSKAKEEHIALLQYVSHFGLKNVFLLGDHFAEVSGQQGFKTFDSMEDLGSEIQSKSYSETAFLVKGSRGMKMERVLDYIKG